VTRTPKLEMWARTPADGWTLMSLAGDHVKRHAPEELDLLQERYRHKSLKILILASEIFNVPEETTNNGGMRALYRLKHGLE